jgi:hypothetical protein
MTPGEIRFAADGMLQSLATWLRLLGYDCATDPQQRARQLLERAVSENRVFLTRNTHLPDNLPQSLLRCAQIVPVSGNHLAEQLPEVVRRFALEPERFAFTRCVECNEQIEAAGSELWRCRRCGKTFWRGSHVRNSLARLRRWLATPR